MEDEERVEPVEETSDAPLGGWAKAAILFVILAGAGFVYALHERAQARRLTQEYQTMGQTLKDARHQITLLNTRVNELSAPPVTPVLRPTPVVEHRAEKAHHAKMKARRSEEKHWAQMEAELARHQKEIDATHQEVAQARTDAENRLASARDELGGSIARNRSQLAALQRQGQQLFYQYDLEKSKHFQRVGPIGIALRKTNQRHQYCDLKLRVDDRVITKKHVNLYEPVIFYPDGYAQALEVVVFEIGKNRASGYVSVPRYTQAQLRAAAGTLPPAAPPQQADTAPRLQHRPAVPAH